MKLVITIDREEVAPSGTRSPWRWLQHRRRGPVGRAIFAVERGGTKRVEKLFDLPRVLDEGLTEEVEKDMGARSKIIARGLRSIRQTARGKLVICDVFGVYETDRRGNIERHVSLPVFNDLHCALPSADGSRILVTSSGTEEIFEIDWAGKIHRRIDVARVFGLPRSFSVVASMKRHPDHRVIPFDTVNQLFHCNWAEWIEEGERMLVSLFHQGMVAIVRRTPDGEWEIEQSWSCFPRCHGPVLDRARGTFIVLSSRTDQAMEVDMATGKKLWCANNIRFGKGALILDEHRVLVTDCNGRRLVELGRKTGVELWSCPTPGIPYQIAVLDP